MSPTHDHLTLSPGPDSARTARRWVRDRLTGIGRADLIESAELAVSELVTNAVLHTGAELVVRVRGTTEHPRVEVRDNSIEPPRPGTLFPEDDEDLMATFGRGLALVSAYSAAWGSHIDDDISGKLVWFEPAPEPSTTETPVDLFSLDEALGGVERPEDTVTVELLGMPVTEFRDLRAYYNDLRRELRLLALSHPEDYPLAAEFSELTMTVERERRMASGPEAMDAAINSGVEHADLRYQVPASSAATMSRLEVLVEQVMGYFDQGLLLSRPLNDRQRELMRWYLGEFSHQVAGGQPRPWPGGYPRMTKPAS